MCLAGREGTVEERPRVKGNVNCDKLAVNDLAKKKNLFFFILSESTIETAVFSLINN